MPKKSNSIGWGVSNMKNKSFRQFLAREDLFEEFLDKFNELRKKKKLSISKIVKMAGYPYSMEITLKYPSQITLALVSDFAFALGYKAKIVFTKKIR